MNNLLVNLGTGRSTGSSSTRRGLAVTDAVILAQRVSSVVFVVGSEMTRRVTPSRRSRPAVRSPRSVTVVLNRVDFSRNKVLLDTTATSTTELLQAEPGAA